ncbi:MAG TPA: hypothetical protein VGV89_07030 [Thermoplasmata archaeon]|nr:hypothetical protein [Thermoplasmata archaeon]
MPKVPADALEQIDSVLKRVKQIQQQPTSSVNLHELETLELALIRRLAPIGTTYRDLAEKVVEAGAKLPFSHPSRGPQITQPLRGIILGLRHDYEGGFVSTVEELVHGSLFADFLAMATYLHAEGYKDPAAVLVGGVLEEHLRKLAGKNSISLEDTRGRRKASALNDDLFKVKAYGSLDQKNVTGWLEIRNDAAHADWSKYNAQQVGLMLQGVSEFIARLPA